MSVTVTGVLIEQPNLRVNSWIKYTVIIYSLQTIYTAVTHINSNNMFTWL